MWIIVITGLFESIWVMIFFIFSREWQRSHGHKKQVDGSISEAPRRGRLRIFKNCRIYTESKSGIASVSQHWIHACLSKGSSFDDWTGYNLHSSASTGSTLRLCTYIYRDLVQYIIKTKLTGDFQSLIKRYLLLLGELKFCLWSSHPLHHLSEGGSLFRDEAAQIELQWVCTS